LGRPTFTVQDFFISTNGNLADLSKKRKTMKTKLLVLAMVLMITGNVFSQQASMVVVIKNVNETKGRVSVALFNKEDDFMGKSLANKSITAKNGEVQITFEGVTPGDYAISVMHDANENDELDSNAFGIPKEGFGFSNDAMGMFGPPSFEKAKFNFTGKSQVVITLKYM
jgi:uncharacterized protein (DUF2141 family)